MSGEERQGVERLRREELSRVCQRSPLPGEQPTMNYAELPEDTSGGRIAREWNIYRREVGRLLAEGHAGRWVLIKGEELVGIWDTEEEANQVRLQRFLMQDVLVKQVLAREPVLRGPTCCRLWTG
jgi:hypothetical protein